MTWVGLAEAFGASAMVGWGFVHFYLHLQILLPA